MTETFHLFQLDSGEAVLHNDPESIRSDPSVAPDNSVTGDNKEIDSDNVSYPLDNRLSEAVDTRNVYVSMDTNNAPVSNGNRNSASIDNRNIGVVKESCYHDNREMTVTFDSREPGRSMENRVRVQGPLASSMKPKPVCINYSKLVALGIMFCHQNVMLK